MCVDANAGARAAAKQKKLEKDAVFEQKRLQFFNKETTFARTLDRNVLGFSRSQADARSRAMQIQGKGRAARQNAVAKYFRSKKVNEGGRSRRFGGIKAAKYFSKVADIDRKMFNLATQGEAKVQTKIQRRQDAMIKREHANLGMGPQFGMPTMMPPKDRAGQLMNSISFGMNVASGLMTMFPSDERLKRDVTKIGQSIDGYNIYKFKYVSSDREFIGVKAQEVLKKKPEAVGKLSNGFYAVYYDMIDVDFKEVA